MHKLHAKAAKCSSPVRSADMRGTSLICPVRLPVIRFGEGSINALNYLRFVVEKRRKMGLKSPISLFFSLLAGSGRSGDRFRRTASTTMQSRQTDAVSWYTKTLAISVR